MFEQMEGGLGNATEDERQVSSTLDDVMLCILTFHRF